MSLVERTEWRAAVEEILALANQEGLLIDREEMEEIWRLRERRRELINRIVEKWKMTIEANGLSSREVDDLSRLLCSIDEADRRNMDRLACLKRDAAMQLVHLYEGRQAVDGYRVGCDQVPLYIDRRG